MKSGSTSAPSGGGGGGGLAITERQKPAPSCVAALFQMFAKRKLFSTSSKKSKLLPPVRAHKFSPGRPPVGGEKTAVAKMRPLLLDSADYSRSKIECSGTSHYLQPGQDRNCSDNEMCAPGVVARLMGLSSMPAVSHQRPTKATDSSEPGDHWNSGRQDWPRTSRSIYTSPQKQQKTGQFIDDRRHDNADLFKAPDTRPLLPRRHARKVASPVKSPRSMSSRNKARLIEAAVKVLEPGLLSRNRRLSWRHAYLEYPGSIGDGAPGAAAVLHNVSDQFLRDMCDIDVPRSGARNIGAASLGNSTSDQRTEEETCKKSIPCRRSDQNVPCQLQPEYFLFSSTGKAGFGDSVQKVSNCIADTNRDVPKKQLKSNISRDSAPHGPLKQNNLKQNASPAACRAADPGYVTQSTKHRSGERNMRNRAQDFISQNKRMNNNASLRSKRKVQDRFGEPRTSAENKNMSTKGCRASNLHGGTSTKLKLKIGTPRAMEKGMIIAKGAGLVSEKPKPASPNCARSDLQRQPVPHNVSRGNKKSGTISLASSSLMKIAPTLRGDNASETGTAVQRSPVDTCPKRRSRRDCQNTSPQREIVFWEDLQDTSNLESTESVFYNQDEVQNRVLLGGRATSSSFENKSGGQVTEESLSNELLKQLNSVDCAIYDNNDPYKVAHSRKNRKKHATDAKDSKPSASISRVSNKRSSPTSILLQSRDADDACVPGIPCNAAEATFINSHPRETCTVGASTVQDMTTESNPRCGDPNSGHHHGVQPCVPSELHDRKPKHPGDGGEVTVTTTVELLLTNVRASSRRHNNKPEESRKAFLLKTTECALATLTAGSSSEQGSGAAGTKDKKGAGALRILALDFVRDCLDSTCSRLSDSGYSSFSQLLPLVCTEERLADRVGKEIARCCGGMAGRGRGLDELAMGEVERAVEAGMDPLIEAVRIGAQIEQDLVQELVDEIVCSSVGE